MKNDHNKRILIVGTGFLGRELVLYVNSKYVECICTHNKNQFFSNSIGFNFFCDDIATILNDYKIDLVILTAKLEFEKNRELLKRSMTRFLLACGERRVVYVSSDGIFSGKKIGGMYDEGDVPVPVTAYGKNLFMCEELVRDILDDYLIVRPSYIFGQSFGFLDSRLRFVQRALESGEVVERFVDMYKSPMDVNQTAKIIVDLATSEFRGVVHVAGDRMSIYDFMQEQMKILGVSTKNLHGVLMPKKAQRPNNFLADTSLDCKLMKLLLQENFDNI